MSWPDWFPEACPPETSSKAAGSFFRLVGSDSITEKDFWSARQLLNAGITSRQYWADSEEFKAVACSVHATRADADAIRASFGALRKKQIAYGDVSGGGRLQHTPSHGNSHHSWWRDVEDAAWKTFTVSA